VIYVKVKRLFMDEKGATLPLVAIILGLFALGFIALVVDVGTLYVERKAMITSADAAALAGAQVLRVNKGANVSDAELVSKMGQTHARFRFMLAISQLHYQAELQKLDRLLTLLWGKIKS
jgi:Flp pilus assembly pilin Flp